jgi:hypothetical protein
MGGRTAGLGPEASVTGGAGVAGIEEETGGTSGPGGFKPPGEGVPERTGLGGSLRGGSFTGPGGIGASLGLSEDGESFKGSLIVIEFGKRWEATCQ